MSNFYAISFVRLWVICYMTLSFSSRGGICLRIFCCASFMYLCTCVLVSALPMINRQGSIRLCYRHLQGIYLLHIRIPTSLNHHTNWAITVSPLIALHFYFREIHYCCCTEYYSNSNMHCKFVTNQIRSIKNNTAY